MCMSMSVTGMVPRRPGGLCGCQSIAIRDRFDHDIHQPVGCRGTEAGGGIPAWTGIETCHSHILHHRVVSARDIVEIGGIGFLVAGKQVERHVDKAKVVPSLLVGHRHNSYPPWRANARSAKGDPAGVITGDIQPGQYAMRDGRVKCHIRYPAPFAGMECQQLVERLDIENAESAA